MRPRALEGRANSVAQLSAPSGKRHRSLVPLPPTTSCPPGPGPRRPVQSTSDLAPGAKNACTHHEVPASLWSVTFFVLALSHKNPPTPIIIVTCSSAHPFTHTAMFTTLFVLASAAIAQAASVEIVSRPIEGRRDGDERAQADDPISTSPSTSSPFLPLSARRPAAPTSAPVEASSSNTSALRTLTSASTPDMDPDRARTSSGSRASTFGLLCLSLATPDLVLICFIFPLVRRTTEASSAGPTLRCLIPPARSSSFSSADQRRPRPRRLP